MLAVVVVVGASVGVAVVVVVVDVVVVVVVFMLACPVFVQISLDPTAPNSDATGADSSWRIVPRARKETHVLLDVAVRGHFVVRSWV